jgi:hypothetical protein
MGKMKALGQQLTEKLEAYANAQESRNAGMQHMIVQGGGYSGQGLINGVQASQMSHAAQANALKNMYSQMQSQAGGAQIRKGPPVVDNPNQREAYVVPLSTLANMWRAKYGDLWVDVSEIDDEFWADASARLHRNKLMEEIEFRESNTPWARLREDA